MTNDFADFCDCQFFVIVTMLSIFNL